jgi:hypothetical protein
MDGAQNIDIHNALVRGYPRVCRVDADRHVRLRRKYEQCAAAPVAKHMCRREEEAHLADLQEHPSAKGQLNVTRLAQDENLHRTFADPRYAFQCQSLEKAPEPCPTEIPCLSPFAEPLLVALLVELDDGT